MYLRPLLRHSYYPRACTAGGNCEGREVGKGRGKEGDKVCKMRHAGCVGWFPTLCRYQDKCEHQGQGWGEGGDKCKHQGQGWGEGGEEEEGEMPNQCRLLRRKDFVRT